VRDRRSGPATLINEGAKITGRVTGDGDFLVSGEVDGECDLQGTLTLARNGRWNGTIRAGNVIVAGHLDGDIEATGKVEITDTARITGTVVGEAIAVAEGAVVEGVMRTTGRAEPLEFVEKRKSD
jgi:cytoskeletal protein CcmA (bactofilin family)